MFGLHALITGRLFSYSDTHRHRLGPNHLQLPVNCPYRVSAKNYQRDGAMCFTDNQGGAPNYYPNSFGGPKECERARKLAPPVPVHGDVYRHSSGHEDNYSQASIFYSKVLSADEKTRLANNISGHLAGASPFIQERAVKNFTQVSSDLGGRIAKSLKLKTTANL